jgi:hypothetical protein
MVRPLPFLRIEAYYFARYNEPDSSRTDSLRFPDFVRIRATDPSAFIRDVWPQLGKTIALVVSSCLI